MQKLEKYDSSIRQKWMFTLVSISARFTAKFELVFVLTQENPFSLRFHFKANRNSIGSSKKAALKLFKIAIRLIYWHVFMR